ncbi:MAG: nucleotidyl transferase AbiEii/AbiGii toxin family protein [bacterium]|nr:nucleotidyl transferase AbiEii/AbiGii toxin family protein [bacterium]
MNEAVRAMLGKYNCRSNDDYKNALKEIIQEIVLLGLSRTEFFNRASFYGGSALRIIHQLDRFSEDLDFSLVNRDSGFSFKPYLQAVQDEAIAFGFSVDVSVKEKTNNSAVESAFLKGNTVEHLLLFPEIGKIDSSFNKNDQIKIKIEIDKEPPIVDGDTEVRYLLMPIPFSLRVYDLPSLFAGKLHAILCREWKSRVKGRDYYDLCWYTARRTPVNYNYLTSKLQQSGRIPADVNCGPELLRQLLHDKIQDVDIEQAKRDVQVFLRHPHAVDTWSTRFFEEIVSLIG